MKNIPNKLFLVIGDDAEDIDNFNNLDHEYVCWSKQRTDVSDIEYVHISDRDKFAIEFKDWCDKLSFMDKVTVHPIAGSGGSSGPRELTNSELLETYLRKLFHSQKNARMKEKAKAKELVDKFMPHTDCAGDGATSSEARQINLNHAKRCALICVDEIIAEYASLHGGLVNAILRTERVVYWQRVRTEIEAL